MAIINREDIKTYIMTSLGWPTVGVELDNIQIGMAITTAVDEYLATGAIERDYLLLKATGTEDGFELPKEVGTVANAVYSKPYDMTTGITNNTDIFSFVMGGAGTMGQLMSAGYGNFIHGAGNLAVFYEYMQNRNRVLGLDITFKVINNKLYLFPYPKPGDSIIVEYSKNAYGVMDEDGAISTSNQWGAYWIKRMALAICKGMLGIGPRGKYSTIAGATGESQTLNGQELVSQSKEEVEKLRLELSEHHSNTQFFIA